MADTHNYNQSEFYGAALSCGRRCRMEMNQLRWQKRLQYSAVGQQLSAEKICYEMFYVSISMCIETHMYIH